MTAILLDLIQSIAPITPETLGQDVYDRFQAEPDTLAIAVIDEPLPRWQVIRFNSSAGFLRNSAAASITNLWEVP